MKIAMFHDSWDVLWWWRVHVENICKQLIIEHNCTITLFVRAIMTDSWVIKDNDEEWFNWKLKIIRCGRPKTFFNPFERFFSLFSMLFIFIKYNKINRYDIIHAHTYLPLLVGKICSIITQIPVIVTIHGSQIMDIWNKNISYYIQKILLTKIKYNLEICVGKNFLEYSNINKVINIWNWVNTQDFEWENNIKKNENIKKLLFVWRLEWTKGVDVLIDSINYIVKTLNIKDIFLDIVWYGYDEKKYKDMVNKYWLNNYIAFHWQKKWKDLVNYYKNSDLMIVPSRAEWFGIIILEAMASGIVVIATKSGWPEDIIQDWINWFLVKKDDYIALASKIVEFVKWKDKDLDKIIYNWYITIKKKYTWEIISKQIYKQYEILITNKYKWK